MRDLCKDKCGYNCGWESWPHSQNPMISHTLSWNKLLVQELECQSQGTVQLPWLDSLTHPMNAGVLWCRDDSTSPCLCFYCFCRYHGQLSTLLSTFSICFCLFWASSSLCSLVLPGFSVHPISAPTINGSCSVSLCFASGRRTWLA